MTYSIIFCLLFLLLTDIRFASQITQERATIHICNSKYVTDCNAFTKRVKRGEVYKTNFTAISKYPMGNNITMKVTLLREGISFQIVNSRLCDIKDVPWLFKFFTTYANFAGKCPFPTGVLGLYNLEFSPKSLPQSIMSLGKGRVLCTYLFEATKTQEVIIEASMVFHF